MTALAKFNPNKIPAHIKKRGTAINAFFRAGSISSLLLPQISIKGKEFALKIGEDTVIADPPHQLKVVVVYGKSSDESDTQRRFYNTKFDSSSDKFTAPNCFSDDMTYPAADASDKQCSTCAGCHWANRGTDLNGRESAACKEYKRIVVMPVNEDEDGETIFMEKDGKPVVAILDVPLTSLRDLAKYNSDLEKKDIPTNAVVTQLGFERGVEYPKLTFTAVAYADADLCDVVESMASDPDVVETCEPAAPFKGEVEAYVPSDAEEEEIEEKPAPKKKRAPAKKAPKKVVEPEPEEEDDDDLEDEIEDTPASSEDDDDLLAELDDWDDLDD